MLESAQSLTKATLVTVLIERAPLSVCVLCVVYCATAKTLGARRLTMQNVGHTSIQAFFGPLTLL